MVSFNSFTNVFSSLPISQTLLKNVAIFGGILLFLGLIIFIMTKFRHYKGRRARIKEIRKGGLGLQKSWIYLEKVDKAEKHDELEEEAIEKEAEKEEKEDEEREEAAGGEATEEKKAEKVLEEVGETSEEQIENEERDTYFEEVLVSLEAFFDETTNVIKDVVGSMKSFFEKEEKEELEIEALLKRIEKMKNFNKIDIATARYLQEYMQRMIQDVEQQVIFEENNEVKHKELLEKMKEGVKDLRNIILDARKKVNEYKKKENKEKRDFGKEINKINNLIKTKKSKLNKEKKKGKKADSSLIDQIKKEIDILSRNKKNLNQLNKRLKETFKFISKQISQLKKIFNGMNRIRRSFKTTDRKIKNRENDLEKRVEKLEELKETINKNVKEFQGEENVHGLVLSLSKNINEYFKIYEEILKSDIGFEEEVKKVLLNELVFGKKLKAFDVLLSSLEESEKTVDRGLEAAVQLVKSILSNDVANDIEKLDKQIEKEITLLDYEEKLNKSISAMEQEIEKRTMKIENDIKELIEKTKKLLNENEAMNKKEQEHLGNSMATMVNKKVDIDKNYLSKAKKFEEQLQKTNANAQKRFKQVKNW